MPQYQVSIAIEGSQRTLVMKVIARDVDSCVRQAKSRYAERGLGTIRRIRVRHFLERVCCATLHQAPHRDNCVMSRANYNPHETRDSIQAQEKWAKHNKTNRLLKEARDKKCTQQSI